MDCAAAARVLEAVQAQSRRHPALRRAAARLSYDLLVVLYGVRPAFLLDYAPGAPQSAIAPLAAAAAQAAAATVALLSLDGCCLIGRRDALAGHLRALQADAGASLASLAATGPLEVTGTEAAAAEAARVRPAGAERVCFVAFRGGGSAGRRPQAPAEPRLLSPAEAQAITASLAPLLDALDAQPGGGGGGGDGGASTNTTTATNTTAATTAAVAVDAGGGGGVLHIALDDMPGLPLQPTLQGLLLGYPIVYDIRSVEEAAAASRALGSRGLRLHRAVAPPAGALAAAVAGVAALGRRGRGGGGGGGGSGGVVTPERDLSTLCAFSVPRGLGRGEGGGEGGAVEEEVAAVAEARVDAAVEAWASRLTGAVEAAAAAAGGDGGASGRVGAAGAGASCWAGCVVEVEEHLAPSVVL